ncbi:MAG: DUF4157 domain-containing protein [Chthonomonadaceae bacterium]|nr:DUF4157 domain-containing protein [Chthonomonadaceae bacterium]
MKQTACIALLLSAALLGAQQPLQKHIYPLAPRLECPPVSVDASDFPEGQAWGEAAKGLVESWFPTVCSLLATEDYKAPSQIRLVIKKKISAPAYTSGNTITINGEWITAHPDDLGMVVHELTHVVQSYPGRGPKPGWLVEGIADYVRWWRYEPEAKRPRIDATRNKYTDSYRTTAYWLAWVSRQYDMGLVPALDRALRHGDDPMPLFHKLTGKDAQALWDEFVASVGAVPSDFP